MKSMRVTVCFGQTRVIVPCKGGATVSELVKEACARYKRAIGKSPKYWVKIRQLENAADGGILDLDDYVYDVAEDRDQLIAVFEEEDDQTCKYNGWDHQSGSSSDGQKSPLSYQSHNALSARYKTDKSAWKNQQQESGLEVDVGVDTLKSSTTHVTVRRESDFLSNKEEESKIQMNKKYQGKSHNDRPVLYYGRREPGSGQEEESQHLHGRMTSPPHQSNTVSAIASPSELSNSRISSTSSDSYNSMDKRNQNSRGKNFGNFVRDSTRQSIMGLLVSEAEKNIKAQNGFLNSNTVRQPAYGSSYDYENFTGTYRPEVKGYTPPPPTNKSKFPSFYNDAQEMFIDIDDRPLGLQVVSYKDHGMFCGLLVKSIDEGGRAEREQILQPGDVIVEINHLVLAQYTLPVAQEIFKNAMKFTELQLRVYPVEERERVAGKEGELANKLASHRHTPSVPILSVNGATPPKANVISSAKSLPDLNKSSKSDQDCDVNSNVKAPLVARMSYDTLSNNTRKIGNMIEIDLRKGDQGLGFSITTRDTPVGDPGPIYIKNILPKGAAIQDGRLQPGDRLIKVNNTEITGHTQESAVNILRCIEVGSVVKLVVSRHIAVLPRKMKDDPVTDKVLNDGGNREYFMFEIALNDTGSAGLGISLKGNQSKTTRKDLGIFVKSVFTGGAAYQDGRLRPNDQLVSVNGQSLLGMTNHEAISTLRKSMSTVGNVRGMIQMVIARRKVSNGPMSPNISSEASSEMSDSFHNERNSRLSFEIMGPSRDEFGADYSFNSNEEMPRQIDPSPMKEFHEDPNRELLHNDDWLPSPEPPPPDIDPFSRESIFRQSISEKRKGAATRDAQNTDTFKAIKSKQTNQAEIEKKRSVAESKRSTTPVSTLKWIKPTDSKTPLNSTPLPTGKSLRSPGVGRRNLNNSSNLPARHEPASFEQTQVEVGPTLGIAKSSSLESLQTAVENYAEKTEESAFPKPKPRVLRGRVLNESFRAALDQSYDLDNFGGKQMTTLKEEDSALKGQAQSSLLTSSDENSSTRHRTLEKKRAGKSYKIFGIFRVGKNKRSMSSDRNLDASPRSSTSSSSPRLPESEVHKRHLESKREDDYKKHQAETERIQAKAKAMREKQEQMKRQARYRSQEDLLDSRIEERIRAPSVPVTAMQRINLDPKPLYSATHSGRRSVDPDAMRKETSITWHYGKTSVMDYTQSQNRGTRTSEKKTDHNKIKSAPDYSSLPRQPRLEPHSTSTVPGYAPDGTVTSPGGVVHRSSTSSNARKSGSGTQNNFSNYEFYNMQKPPGSVQRKPSPSTSNNKLLRQGGTPVTEKQGKKIKPGRTLYYDDTDDSASPSSSLRSKSSKPTVTARGSGDVKYRTGVTTNGFNLSSPEGSFHREESPEPPPVNYRRSEHFPADPSTVSGHSVHTRSKDTRQKNKSAYRHSVHVDSPATHGNQRHVEPHSPPSTRASRSVNRLRNVVSPTFRWRTELQEKNNVESSDSDSYRTASPANSDTIEHHRQAYQKILQSRYREQNDPGKIMVSLPYNL